MISVRPRPLGGGRARLQAALAATVLALGVAACGGGSALGDASPPASLDPASPHLAAVDIGYDQATLAVPAGRAFVLVFENRDAVQHNVSIYANAALEGRQFQGVLFSGPATRWYPVPALAPGKYVFSCDLHPSMRGTLEAR
jgi:plastocyanin